MYAYALYHHQATKPAPHFQSVPSVLLWILVLVFSENA